MQILRWIRDLLLCLAVIPPAFGACKIAQVAAIPVKILANRIMIDAQLNGQDAKVSVDTGALATFLWEDEALRLDLPLATEERAHVIGVGGEARVAGTLIKRFQMGSFLGENLRLTVFRMQHRRPQGADALVLGDDFFSKFTTEFDLEHHVIRLLRPEGCQTDQLAYWSHTYSLAQLAPIDYDHPRIQTHVLVNGKSVNAILDSGAKTSVIALQVAESIGLTPGKGDTVRAGTATGIAGKPIETWMGTFASFAIGDEAMRNVKLVIADMFSADAYEELGTRFRHQVDNMPNMLVGCDFFLSHRIVVLPKEHAMLFTYNGGPVFQVVKSEMTPKDVSEPKEAPAVPAPAAATPQ
jgi:predicted aspartyl protease